MRAREVAKGAVVDDKLTSKDRVYAKKVKPVRQEKRDGSIDRGTHLVFAGRNGHVDNVHLGRRDL
jgi:hypothetical protein